MKKWIYKPALLAAFLIVIYLAGLLIGMIAVSFYPIFCIQKPSMLNAARSVAQNGIEESEDILGASRGPTTRILCYSPDGSCAWSLLPDNLEIDALDRALQKRIPSVLSQKEIFALMPSHETPSNLLQIWSVVGVPVEESGSVSGALFLIRNLENVQESILGYFTYFTILYWLCTYFIVTFVRKTKKLEEVQRNYIANVTHALKAPIASVKALMETLSDTDLDPDTQRVYFGMILQETNLQNHMVQEILELSKVQSKEMDCSKTSVNASEVFNQTLEKYSTLCGCARISLHVSDAIAQLPPLYTNAACIKQVLEILLENAVKYVGEGDDIWIDVSTSKNQVIFCVRDNGIGIAREDQPHVFERFYRCGRSESKGGSGLGLAIAKETMDGLKERIWVESEPRKGTAFYFTVRFK